MPGELRAPASAGLAIKAIVFVGGDCWNGSFFEPYTAANAASYAVPLVASGLPTLYIGSFPAGIPAGSYDVYAFIQAGSTFQASDLAIEPIAIGSIAWTGTAEDDGSGGFPIDPTSVIFPATTAGGPAGTPTPAISLRQLFRPLLAMLAGTVETANGSVTARDPISGAVVSTFAANSSTGGRDLTATNWGE